MAVGSSHRPTRSSPGRRRSVSASAVSVRPRAPARTRLRVGCASSCPTPSTGPAQSASARASPSTGRSDTIDPVLESQICIGQDPPPTAPTLIFLGTYRAPSPAAAGFPTSCPAKETATDAPVPVRGHREGQRREPWPLEGRLLLHQALGIDRPHLRARPGDGVLQPGPVCCRAATSPSTDPEDLEGQPWTSTQDQRAQQHGQGRGLPRRGFLAGVAGVSAGAIAGRRPAASYAAAAQPGSGLHGVPLRGMFLTSKDRLAEGRFGSMFKKLPAFAPRDDLLTGLAIDHGRGPDHPGRRQPQHQPEALRGVHVHRPVHRPRHHLRQHSPRAAAGGSGRARELPDTALRPRLDLRARAAAGTPVLRPRGPRQALAQAQRQRRPGRATRRCRTSRHPGAAQRREPHRRPAAPGPGPVPQPARRPGPVAGHPARVGLRDRPSADALALPVGRDARLPATRSSATSWWEQRAPSTRRSPARRP